MLLADLSSATYTTSSPRLLSKYSAAADLVLRVFDLTMVVVSGLIAYRIVFGSWV
ncbi:MAG: undecaprenyl-phosphate glucose phosphotransferase, partial [Xanthomonas perforans]|nr:undecaprenyl-phosphate glucose phosphotransferase [Xanthomonas perforans]